MTTHRHYEPHLIPMSNTVIKTCICYESYWIQLKNLSFPVVEFDYSIEKAFSYRKYFSEDRLLFHFCINCFNEIVNSVPLRIVEFEMQKGYIRCIYKIKHNIIPIGHCCPTCINFVIQRYSSMFFKTV